MGFGLTTIMIPMNTSTVQTTPLHPPPPLTNPPLFHLPPIIATWFASLFLPQPLVPMPQDYQSKIPHFTRAGSTTSKQHVDRINDAFEYQGIEEETIKMRMFAQSLGGEAKKWLKSLTPNNIHDLPSLYQTFINKWEIKKNPLQVLSE